jgi:choline dehydrogenase-like flavoprotein
MDTIVVGAGSAGAVIASRVTERTDRRVLLVEAGPDYPDLDSVPADLRDGTRNSFSKHDWGYLHRPTSGQMLFRFPRGKVVGGSSAVNTCIALRGHPYDYDEWAALGLPEWSFERCLPYLKRLERDLDFDNQWHGQDGPVPLRRHPPGELTPWQAAFLEACDELGYPRCADHNNPTLPAGAGPHAMNKVDGQRMSAARCYLGPAVRRRDNLRIRAGTVVRRVRFQNRKVVGLEVEGQDGRGETIPAERVVLCAGAIGSPGILLRSGVGPRREVERLGADLVADVPAVGARLLDHPGAALFVIPRRGVCRVSDPCLQTALRCTSEASPHPGDIIVQPGSIVHLPWTTLPMVSVMVQVGKPRGHGYIHFPDADPRGRPRIESAILHHPVDRDAAVEAIMLAYRLAARPAMRKLGWFAWPPEAVLRQKPRVEDWIRRICDSGYHPCGTVPMGPDGRADAAVDARGRVRGVEGLFVADASIMPTVPSSNINLPTLMIGERFGEWLRDGDGDDG